MSLMMLYGLLGQSAGIQVSANTNNVTNDDTIATVVAGVQFNASGVEWASNTAGTYNVSRGLWLDVGLPENVWVERTTVASLDVDPGTGRKQLSTTHTYSVSDSTTGGGSVDAVVTFDFYNAASGGDLLDSVTITLSANKSL